MASEKDILDAVLALPVDERARTAHEQLVSLDELEDWDAVRERLTQRWRSGSPEVG